MIDHDKWPRSQAPADDIMTTLESRIAAGDKLASERVITDTQLHDLLDRAVAWRRDNKAALNRLFDSSALDTYEQRDWEDFIGSSYSDEYMLRRIRELISRDVLYLTVLLSYVKTTGGRTIQSTRPPHDNAQRVGGGVPASIGVFLSHSSIDLPIADALVALLRSALNLESGQIRCTSVPGYKLPAGAVTDEQLRAEIFQATTFVGLITDNSMDSAYVLFELGARWLADKHLVPLLAAGTDAKALRGPLAKYNALSAENASDVHQFVQDLARKLDVRVQPPAGYQQQLESLIKISRDTRRPPTPAPPSSTTVSDHRSRDLSDDEIVGILQAWIGSRPATETGKPIYFDRVDAELELPKGSAQKFLETAASRYRYVVDRKGPSLILFRQRPANVRIKGGL